VLESSSYLHHTLSLPLCATMQKDSSVLLAGELTELVKEREIKVEKIRVYLWRKMGKKAGFVWIPQQS